MTKVDWAHTIRNNLLTLEAVGLWPKTTETYELNLYMFYALISVILFIDGSILFQIMHVVYNHSNLESITGPIFMIMTQTLGSIKILYFIQNMKIIKQLMSDLTDELFQPRSTKQMQIIQPTLAIWKKTYVVFWTLVTATAFMWAAYPFLNKSFIQHELPLRAHYPYGTDKFVVYVATYLHQVVGLFLVSIASLNVDTLMAALMVYIRVQCDILCDNLRSIEKNSNFNETIIRCISHHKKIISFAKKSNKFFSVIVLGQFFTTSVSIGLAMFRLSLVAPLSSESYSLLFYVSAVTVQLLLYCWFGNEVEVKAASSSIVFTSTFFVGMPLTEKEKNN